MKIDPASIATLLAALTEIPVRMAAMERALTELATKVEALRAAAPPLLVPISEAAAICRVSVVTMRRWVRTGQVSVMARGFRWRGAWPAPRARCEIQRLGCCLSWCPATTVEPIMPKGELSIAAGAIVLLDA